MNVANQQLFLAPSEDAKMPDGGTLTQSSEGAGRSSRALCVGALMAIYAVQKEDFPRFREYFDGLCLSYLMLEGEELSSEFTFLLIDLAWRLCLKGRAREARCVNQLIEVIRDIEQLD